MRGVLSKIGEIYVDDERTETLGIRCLTAGIEWLEPGSLEQLRLIAKIIVKRPYLCSECRCELEDQFRSLADVLKQCKRVDGQAFQKFCRRRKIAGIVFARASRERVLAGARSVVHNYVNCGPTTLQSFSRTAFRGVYVK